MPSARLSTCVDPSVLTSAFPRIHLIACADDLVPSRIVLGFALGDVHVHGAVHAARHHFGTATRAVFELCPVEGCRNRFACKIAIGGLHRRLIELDGTVHPCGPSARCKGVFCVGKSLGITFLQSLAEWIIDSLKVIKTTVEAIQLAGRMIAQRHFVVVDQGDDATVALESCFVKLPHKRLHPWWDHRIEDAIHLAVPYFGNAGRVFGLVNRIILFERNFSTIGLNDLANVFVELLRPDIIGRGQSEAFPALRLDQIGNELVTLLRWCRPGAIEMLGALLALILLWIDVQRTAAVDDRVLDRLAHRAGDPAQNDVYPIFLDQPADVADRDPGIGRRVRKMELDRQSGNTTGTIDLLDHELSHLPIGIAPRCESPCNVRGDTQLNWRRRERSLWSQKPAAGSGDPTSGGERRCADQNPPSIETVSRRPPVFPWHLTSSLC